MILFRVLKSIGLLIIFFSSKVHAQKINKKALDSIVQSRTEVGPNQAGVSIIVVNGTKTLYIANRGNANIENGTAITDSSLFDLASMSKQFVAASILMLEQEGKLNVSDKLSKYFPELPAYKDSVTLWQLMHHTSGIQDYVQLTFVLGLYPYAYYTDDDVLHWLMNLPQLNFTPGEKELYSNSNYWLLGKIIERVSGETLETYANKKIFNPLNMNNTRFISDPGLVVKNRVSHYTTNEGELKKVLSNDFIIGPSGVYSHTKDMGVWMRECINKSKFGIDFWAKMLMSDTLNNGDVTRTACGLFVTKASFGHGGYSDGAMTDFEVYKDAGLGVLFLSNQDKTSLYKIMTAFKSAIFPDSTEKSVTKGTLARDTLQVPMEELKKFTGRYAMKDQLVFDVSLKNDSLWVKQEWDENTYPIFRWKGSIFRISSELPITFQFLDTQNGKTANVRINQGKRVTEAVRVEIKKKVVDLHAFVGEYYHKALDKKYKVYINNQKLVCEVSRDLKLDLVVLNEDLLSYAGAFDFKINRRKGQIVSFTLDAGRVNGLTFEKIEK